MPDREKYIDIFEQIVKAKKKYYRSDEIPIRISYQCVVDILALLKEQSPNTPKKGIHDGESGKCPICGYRAEHHYCPNCGQALYWD